MAEIKTGHYLPRDAAAELIRDISSSGIIRDELSEMLDEVAFLIEAELDGEHLWGQPYENSDKLRIAYRSDLWTDELKEECKRQHENARFIPAPCEREELKEYFMSNCDYEEENAEARQQLEDDFNNYYGINSIS